MSDILSPLQCLENSLVHKMLIDFPDFSLANQWQIKTIEEFAPIEVKRISKLGLVNCYALHVSWEDHLLKDCKTFVDAETRIAKIDEYLKKQSNISKVIWTVHNLTSHSSILKDAETLLRSVIMEYASTINLMSMKHAFMIPETHRKKINIVPHYIDHDKNFNNLEKQKQPTYFKFGADRGRKDNDVYIKILNNPDIRKFVSDKRLKLEIDDGETVITNRRFTFYEAEFYAQLANFSTFYQKSTLNSGVLNFMIGKKIAVFHDEDSVRFMDLPQSYNEFCLELEAINEFKPSDWLSNISINDEDVDDFIRARNPINVSKIFWEGVFS